MIDLHNHLLPGIDDGSANLSETLEMCRVAAEDGIRVIVATPHSFDGDHVTSPELITNVVRDLNENLRRKGEHLRVLPGMEIRVGPELLELVEAGKVLPLNQGRFLLLEFQHAHVPAGFGRLTTMLKESGYGAVLGHPEKNLQIQRDPDYLPKLVDSLAAWDLIIQVSADSLTGAAGKVAYKTARFLLKSGMACIIATDAHSVDLRPPILSSALAEAARIVGQERALQMVKDVPLAIIKGIGFPTLHDPAPPRRWWQIFS